MYYFTKIIIIHIFMTNTHDSWLPYSCPSSIYLLMAPLTHAPPLITSADLPYSCLSSFYLLMAPLLMPLLYLPVHGSLTHAPTLSTCSWLSYLLIAPPCSACSIYLLMAPPCSACSISSCERSLTNHSKLFWSRLIQKKST